MRSEAVDTITMDGPGGVWKADIFQDQDAQPPYEYCDMVGTLITWHRRYRFEEQGDQLGYERGQDWLDAVEDDIKAGKLIYIDVSMLDHSGISLYEGSSAHAQDPGGWDSGQVGFFYVSKSHWDKTHGGKWRKSIVQECLRSELKMWDQYVTGDVYGIVVTGPNGEENPDDSCWGFWGIDDARSEAKSMLENAIEHEKHEAEKIARVMAL